MIATVATALLGAVTHVESPNAAEAAPATLAAIAPATDVRKAVPIGPAGQVYEPDGKGAWVRRRAGGTAAVIIGATAIGTTVIAGAKSAPPFKLKGGTWTAVFLTPKAKAIVGTGSRVLTAVGKQVFALDTTAAQPTRLPDAPSRISAVAAGRSRAVAVTDKGLVELVGKAGTPAFYGDGGGQFPMKFGQGQQVFRVGVADQDNVLAEFVGGEASVLSGLMVGADQIRGRAFAVDINNAHNGKGRVLMFANNPVYRWQNHGEFNMVFNSIVNWNDVPSPPRPNVVPD
jgi:hypothetical protein